MCILDQYAEENAGENLYASRVASGRASGHRADQMSGGA